MSSTSARLVRMIGTRAPSTIPAASAPARNERLLASMLPASRSGTTSTLARPATGETIFFTDAASALIALSSASGPSSTPPVIWPRSAILHSAAASSVEVTSGLMVSIALRIATHGSATPIACARSMAFWTMSTFTLRSGAMLTAASVITSASSWPGTSMMKQWLIRRPVRNPVSRATTADISSSVCRLPFIKASARPSRTSATALAAASWLCTASTSSNAPMSIEASAAARSILSRGPTRIGVISCSRAASTALSSETLSHGCAIAVTAGSCCRARSTSRMNFP